MTIHLNNPDVIRIKALIDEVNQQIDARVNGIMISLENNLNTEKAALDTLRKQVDTCHSEGSG